MRFWIEPDQLTIKRRRLDTALEIEQRIALIENCAVVFRVNFDGIIKGREGTLMVPPPTQGNAQHVPKVIMAGVKL